MSWKPTILHNRFYIILADRKNYANNIYPQMGSHLNHEPFNVTYIYPIYQDSAKKIIPTN